MMHIFSSLTPTLLRGSRAERVPCALRGPAAGVPGQPPGRPALAPCHAGVDQRPHQPHRGQERAAVPRPHASQPLGI